MSHARTEFVPRHYFCPARGAFFYPAPNFSLARRTFPTPVPILSCARGTFSTPPPKMSFERGTKFHRAHITCTPTPWITTQPRPHSQTNHSFRLATTSQVQIYHSYRAVTSVCEKVPQPGTPNFPPGSVKGPTTNIKGVRCTQPTSLGQKPSCATLCKKSPYIFVWTTR